MLNVATFNIFWYPESGVAQNERKEADDQRIARVLRNLAPHVVVFQEILDITRLQRLLERLGDNFRLRQSPAGSWLASGSVASTKSMKIVCAYDADALELIRGAKLYDPVPDRRFNGRRYPYALHLRDRGSGWEFTVVGVHFKSGLLGSDPTNDAKRKKEVAHLARWLAGEPDTGTGHFERPPTPDVIVIGDFNALEYHQSLAELRTGALEAWDQARPQVAGFMTGEEVQPLEDPQERWTTYLDREIIDHVITSPSVKSRFLGPPLIYAFDLDPAMDDYPSPGGPWLRRRTSYQAKPYGGASLQTVPNLYRISDHRPLRMSLDIG